MHNGAESVGNSNTPVCSSCPKNRDSTTYYLLPTIYQKGFTIVELLVVIVVIGILAAITIVSYTVISNKATVASLQSDLSSSSQQLKVFQVINSAYPSTYDCSIAESTTNICLKKSGTNNLVYSFNNSTNPQTFCITASNGTNNYRITNDSIPTLGTCSSLYASGGTIADIGGYRIHTFNSSDSFTVNSGISSVDVLVVAGGGGGGGDVGGGGGAGGLIYSTSYAVSPGSITVTIGSGGSGSLSSAGVHGANSVFGSLTAIGGGGGGSWNGGSGVAGGSGGGATSNVTGGGGAGTAGQGMAGGAAAGNTANLNNYSGASGGGGAGQAGGPGISAGWGANSNTYGYGGNGLQYGISGTPTYYAGGGGSSSDSGTYFGIGGLGGGGNGNGFNAVVNTGGGGGGGGGGTGIGGNGGSGIVIVRYLLP